LIVIEYLFSKEEGSGYYFGEEMPAIPSVSLFGIFFCFELLLNLLLSSVVLTVGIDAFVIHPYTTVKADKLVFFQFVVKDLHFL